MKKVKQILAIVGVIILVGLYVSTIVCAVSAHDIHLCLCDHPCFDLGIQFYL